MVGAAEHSAPLQARSPRYGGWVHCYRYLPRSAASEVVGSRAPFAEPRYN